MLEEPELPKTRRPALDELAREDLELYGVVDLQERIEALEAEIVRTRQAIDKRQAGRSAADALFSFGKS